MRKAIVIADDLTGAADTGLPFQAQGLSTGVLLAGGDPGRLPAGWEAVVLSTETRNASEAAAGARLDALGARLSETLSEVSGGPCPLVYKKIDSTLRGWIGAEVAALLRRLPRYTAWIVPAYPAQGRRMTNGVYTVHDTPLYETPFARDLPGLPRDARVQPLLEGQMRQKIGFVAWDLLRRGPEAVIARVRDWEQAGTRALLFDAFADEHFDPIVAAGERSETPVLWVGSAGLAHPIARRVAARGEKDSCPHPQNTLPETGVVIVAGSQSPVTLRQIAYLKERVAVRHWALPLEPDLPAREEAAAPESHCLLTFAPTGSGTEPGPPPSDLLLASRLGEFAAGVIARSGSRRLILTGGDIAAATLRHLNAEALEILGPAEEGMPVCRVCGGAADGALAVTKAGGFGTDPSLYRALRLLEGEQCA